MKRVARGVLPISIALLFACDPGNEEAAPAGTNTPAARPKADPPAPVEKRERPPFAIEAGADAAKIWGDTLNPQERAQIDSWPDDRSQRLRESRWSKTNIPAPAGFDADKATVEDWRGVLTQLARFRAATTGKGADGGADQIQSEVHLDAYSAIIRAGALHRSAELYAEMHVLKSFIEKENSVAVAREFVRLDKRYGGFIAEHHTPDNVEEESYYHPQTVENALVIYRYMSRMMGRGASLELTVEYLDDRADLLATLNFLGLQKFDADMMAPLAAADAPLAEKAKLTWADGETQYFLLEGKVRKTLSKQGDKVEVLEAEAARAAWAKQVQSLIVADKATRKRAMATMHYGETYDIILADQVIAPEQTERQRIAVGKPASASHELTLALEKRGKATIPFFDHAGLGLAPELREKGTTLVSELEKAYPNNKFEVPEPPAPEPEPEPEPETDTPKKDAPKKKSDAPKDAPPKAGE